MHLVRSILLMLASTVLLASSAYAAELVMYRRAGCPWCQAWDREIGPVYGKTEIGQRAPLRLAAIERERPPISLKTPIIYSPTFVVVEAGVELGRIEGYPGPDFFWGLLERLVQRLPSPTTNDAISPPADQRSE